MSNIVNQKGVIILDTAADNIVAAGIPVRIAKIRFKATASGNVATITDAGGSVAKWEEISTATGVQTLVLDGLRLLSITGASSLVYVYTA
jgi:hypothetical protein